jgi:hypothetical protein
VIVATLSLAAVVVLSVLLAKRQPNPSSQPNLNTTQIALTSALQAASEVYRSNGEDYPRGQALLGDLQTSDPELSFAFGPQSVSPTFTSGPYRATGISVAVSTDGLVIMFAAQGTDGSCWYVTNNREVSTSDGDIDGAATIRGTSYATAGGQPSCTSGAGLPSNATKWRTTWPTRALRDLTGHG